MVERMVFVMGGSTKKGGSTTDTFDDQQWFPSLLTMTSYLELIPHHLTHHYTSMQLRQQVNSSTSLLHRMSRALATLHHVTGHVILDVSPSVKENENNGGVVLEVVRKEEVVDKNVSLDSMSGSMSDNTSGSTLDNTLDNKLDNKNKDKTKKKKNAPAGASKSVQEKSTQQSRYTLVRNVILRLRSFGVEGTVGESAKVVAHNINRLKLSVTPYVEALQELTHPVGATAAEQRLQLMNDGGGAS